jgi:TPP-dependent indolepyruvate ferredoxin oxidoreductase alpha subunit
MIAIRDLDFFEIFDQSKQICGGIYANVNVSASTSQNVALANAQSTAMGDNTSTWTQTTTNVTIAPFFTSSYARSDGIAIAQSGFDSSRVSDTTMLSSTYVNYSP